MERLIKNKKCYIYNTKNKKKKGEEKTWVYLEKIFIYNMEYHKSIVEYHIYTIRTSQSID
jgi:hypothetical protein